MKEQFPHYNIEHLNDKSNKVLDFEVLVFDKLETLLKRTTRSEYSTHHMHSFYSFVWIDKGSASQSIDGKIYEQKENNLLFICPGQIHLNEIKSTDDVSGGILLFSPDFFTLLRNTYNSTLELNFLDSFYANPLLKLLRSEFVIIKQTINSIISERNHDLKDNVIIQSLLFALILQIQRHIDVNLSLNFPKQSINIYKKFSVSLEQHFKNGLSIEEYALGLNITSRHLNRLIKEVTGKSTSQIIRGRIILEAKRLLSYTSLSISEVSSSLGYTDDSYFNKIFKKELGITPKSFRMKMSE